MQVRFGDYEFHESARELHARGRVIRLQEQPSQVLRLLIEKAGQVVTREELHQRLWPAKVYFDVDHGLNNAVTRLREVLHDSADRPRYIETIPRVGYRFIAPLTALAAAAPVAVQPPPQGSLPSPQAQTEPPLGTNTEAPSIGRDSDRRKRGFLAYAAVAAAALLGGAYALWPSAPQDGRIRALVVLPLENLSSEPEKDYFVDGMTDALINDLARIGQLNVISRTTAMHYKGVHEPVPRLARELKVDAVVEGSVVRAGSKVRVNVRLLRGADEHPLWAQSYDRDLGSVIALQGELAQAVAGAITGFVTPTERGRIASAHVPPPQAYDDYLRGMHLFAQRNQESELASIPFFKEAIAADPSYAAAYAGLSQAYALLGGTIAMGLRDDESAPKALEAARKAVALDPQLADSWTALDMAIEDAADPQKKLAVERAVLLNPGDGWVHKRRGDFLWDSKDLSAAISEYELSLRLDPLNPSTNATYGDSLVAMGRVQEGLTQLRRTVQLDPWYLVARFKLGLACTDQGYYEEAIEQFQKAREISPGSLPAQVGLAVALAAAQRTSEAEALLQTIVPRAEALGHPSAVALLHVRLHHRAEALEWLQRSIDAKDYSFFEWPDDGGWLATDPAFLVLARKVKDSQAAPATHSPTIPGA